MPPSPRAIGVGDLVGLNDAKGPQLALVLQLRGTRADLVVGYEGRAQQVPLRLLDRLAAAGASANGVVVSGSVAVGAVRIEGVSAVPVK